MSFGAKILNEKTISAVRKDCFIPPFREMIQAD